MAPKLPISSTHLELSMITNNSANFVPLPLQETVPTNSTIPSHHLDITSSCLYVAGIAAQSSGKFTPISLFIVVIVLYFFRSIYTEVGTALPLNGGSYNVLLNSTTKL